MKRRDKFRMSKNLHDGRQAIASPIRSFDVRCVQRYRSLRDARHSRDAQDLAGVAIRRVAVRIYKSRFSTRVPFIHLLGGSVPGVLVMRTAGAVRTRCSL